MRLLILAWIISLVAVGGAIAWLEYGSPPSPAGENAEEEQAAVQDSPVDEPGPAVEPEEATTGEGTAAAGTEDEQPASGAVSQPPANEQADRPQVTPADRVTPGGDPLDMLYEEAPQGPLPVTRDGLTPLQAFAADPVPGSNPAITIVLTGLGLNEERTRSAILNLPHAVTLAFSPYGSELAARTEAARASGHELLLMVPMEPQNYPANDPGPDTLQAGINPQQNINRLHNVMSRFRGYVGLINHMGSRFTADPDALRPVMEDLQRRGLLFVDSRSSGTSVLPEAAGAHGIPVLENDRYLDNQPRAEAIRKNLADLEAVARQRGYAVGVARALPVTIATLSEWAESLAGRGYRLVPASQLVSIKSGE